MTFSPVSTLPSRPPTQDALGEHFLHEKISEVERQYVQTLVRLRAEHEHRLAEFQRAEAAAQQRLDDIRALCGMNPEAEGILDFREQERGIRTSISGMEDHMRSLEDMLKRRSQDLERMLETESRHQQFTENLKNIEDQITQRQIDLATLCQRLAREEALLHKDSHLLRESVELLRAEELAVRKRVGDQKILLGQMQAEAGFLHDDLAQQEQAAYYFKPGPEAKITEADHQEVTKRLVKLADLVTTAHEFLQKPANHASAPEQCKLLRESTMAVLSALNVAEVVIEPGTLVDWEMRSKIHVSGHQSGEGRSVVREMLSPGYAVLTEEGRQFFIRKPEVLTATEATEEILHA